MALRMSPTNKRDKQRLRQLERRREEERDRIIRIIKGRSRQVKMKSSRIILADWFDNNFPVLLGNYSILPLIEGS